MLHLVPTSLVADVPTTIYLRASRTMGQATLHIGDVISRKLPVVRPSEMIEIHIPQDVLTRLTREKEARVEVIET